MDLKRLLIAIGIGIPVLLFAAYGFLYYYGTQQTVPRGTVVGGAEIGGLTIGQALKELNRMWDEYENRAVRIEANPHAAERSDWTLGELGFVVERDEVSALLLKLQEGTLLEKAEYRYHFPRSHDLKLKWNRELFEKQIRAQWGWLEFSEPANAQRTITDNDEIVYRPHTDAYRLDMKTLFENVKKWAVAGGNPDPESPDSAMISVFPIAADMHQSTYALPLHTISPNLTLERLKEQGIDRKIASFTTDFSTSSEGRAFNVASTASTLDHWELAPGEVFDYRKVIHATEEHYGFREAPVILNGELVPGVGGGICQVSSTLYNAVLLAGLEIVERRNHSLPVSYLPTGRDATFADGYINFRFKNTTGKHLIIRTEVENRELTVKLFGTMPENVSYRIESKTVKVIEPPVREVQSAAVPPGGRIVLQNGKPGYEVDTYRIKLVDDAEVSREKISHDRYKPQTTTVGVPASGNTGPNGKPAAPSVDSVESSGDTEAVIEDGVDVSGI
ncbi:VanW family protein [Paenibacillus tarimensis]